VPESIDTQKPPTITVAVPTQRRRRKSDKRTWKWAAIAVLAVIALIAPLYLTSYWLQLVFAVSAIAIGAIGLNLVTGTADQLSLANPFFMVVGALTYVVLCSEADAERGLVGLGLPPIVGLVGGVALAMVAGLLFSPIASRLRGIYLGMASFGLVFVAIYVLNNAGALSGGFNGRSVPTFELFGIVFGRSDEPLVIAGVPFGRWELLWYLGLILLVLAAWFASNILKSRSGRALRLIASGDLPASVSGVHVAWYKAQVFAISGMYAGLAGVLYALSIGSIAPETFSLELALEFLAMIVIGGMGSVAGAIIGATFVAALPLLLQYALGGVPMFQTGEISAANVANYVYGLAVILVLIFKPSGLVGIWRDVMNSFRRRKNIPTTTES
jgi:ABC-type branched-chain amino acid transport system, permease component